MIDPKDQHRQLVDLARLSIAEAKQTRAAAAEAKARAHESEIADERMRSRSWDALEKSRVRLTGKSGTPVDAGNVAGLKLADEHLARGRDCVQKQLRVIEQLAQANRSTDLARSILHTMENTLRAMEEHRAMMSDRSRNGETIQSACATPKGTGIGVN